MKPRITLTGVDESTSADTLFRLAAHAEIGFLFTLNPEGRKRYPSLDWIRENAMNATWVALHVCGREARQMLVDPPDNCSMLFQRFQRIQVNGQVSEEELKRICAAYPLTEIITQHKGNDALLKVPLPNHSILVDASGGRGIRPAEWTKLETYKKTGYAGGLGAENICDEWAKIRPLARIGCWLDMESKLRDANDSFSEERAVAVLKALNYEVDFPLALSAMPLLKLSREEWLKRCAARLMERAALNAADAMGIAESNLESDPSALEESPEDIADEELSRWGE
ncbi:MAG TPA: hypothetical protein VGH19_06560 [Verrucomicrobiae bacterium]